MASTRTLQLVLSTLTLFALSGPALADRDDDSGGGLKNYFTPGTKTKITSGQDSPNINEAQSEVYDGPKARIAVSRFTDKTHHGWWNHSIGDGMADQLATALFNSNRYIVLERQQLDDVLVEQDLGASGRIAQATAAQIGQIEGAELLITGAVTEFQGNAGGTQGRVGGAGWGGWSKWGAVVGSIAGGVRKAHIAIDVRVIDARTSRIVAATSVEGEAKDFNLGAGLGHYYGGGALGGALSTWKNTPIEKALRICIQEAVDFIAAKTPPVYYRHGQGTVQSAKISAPSPTSAALSRPPTPAYPKGAVVRVKSSKLNMRSGPGTNWQVVSGLAQNDPLLVLEQNQDWIQVQTTTNVVGWVAAWLIYPDNAVTAADFTKIGLAAAQPAPTVAPAPAPAAAPQPEPKVMPAAASAAPAKAPASAALDFQTKLKKLKDLYDLELITEEEYNAKRAEIISQF